MKSIFPLPVACLFFSLIACAPVQADRHSHHHHRVVVRPAHSYTRIVVRSHPYYYHLGHYYRHGPRGYFLVAPPLGAVVAELPLGAIRLRFGTGFYHYYGGVYYSPAPHGYVIVTKPRTDTVYVEKESGPDGAVTEEPFQEPKSVTIMIANSNGSKTPVPLEELEDGKYKGPRGEIYDSLPGDDQLRPVYGF